jgi:hypothetical protein
MREKTDETDERADRWERREDTSRGKTDEHHRRGQQRRGHSDKRTERNRRNSFVELIFGRSFDGEEESKKIEKKSNAAIRFLFYNAHCLLMHRIILFYIRRCPEKDYLEISDAANLNRTAY